MIHMDDLHFVVAKKNSQFKIKAQVGPFMCNTRTTSKEADLLLKQLSFELSFTWSYGPFVMISGLMVEQKTTPYTHTLQQEIEQYMNQYEWEENTMQEKEEKILSKMTSQTPIP